MIISKNIYIYTQSSQLIIKENSISSKIIKDVEEYSVVGGVPIKFIKKEFK